MTDVKVKIAWAVVCGVVAAAIGLGIAVPEVAPVLVIFAASLAVIAVVLATGWSLATLLTHYFD